MVIRGDDAKNLHLQKISDIAPIAPNGALASATNS